VNQVVRPPRAGAPDAEHVHIESVTQEVVGTVRHLRGAVRIETSDMQLKADEVDYDADTGDAHARGHVHFEHFVRGEKLDCDSADYNINLETGKFYDVSGSANTRVQARKGLLTTKNPFYFQGKWAERLNDHYILHDGFLTDCTLPRAWWRLKGPTFEVVPGEHATGHNAWFYFKGMPLIYLPYYYKSLEKRPRRSGIMNPNFGNSSTRGATLGLGYYWAINRSYDFTYHMLYYSAAGLTQHVGFRGDPNEKSKFDIQYDKVDDRRPLVVPASGAFLLASGKTDLGHGWLARGDLDYITSFGFREQYTDSFNEAVQSETHSVGYITKHWSDYGINIVTQQDVNFQSTTPHDDIIIRKLPEVEFTGREHEVDLLGWPFWLSLDSSAGLLRRSEPEFQTRQFVERLDFAPHVTTAFHLDGFQLLPSFGIRETGYRSSMASDGTISGQNVLRNSRDFSMVLIFPSLQRIFGAPSWVGDKVKHIIEPRITYLDTSGIDNFTRIIRFDQTDVLSNTNQVEFSLTNRLLAKQKNGTVTDFATWQVSYQRYFDPTFGGAIVPGTRNVLQSALDMTGYAFLDGYRHSSPVVSMLRVQSRVGIEWRTDYDPVLRRIVNSSLTLDTRVNKFHFAIGQTALKSDPILAPSANQVRGALTYGSSTRPGLSYGFSSTYDYLKGVMLYSQTQISYNTDCCGLSLQYFRFAIGIRDESQFRVSFQISNIGTFGTLKAADAIF
jgi:LPS-assembly protein